MSNKCEYEKCNNDLSGKRKGTRFCCRDHKNLFATKKKYYELKSDKYRIYKLVYNDEIIYIGKTTNDLRVRKNNGYAFIPFYKDCSIELIEETNDPTRESYWIKYYKEQGCNLYNRNKGDGFDIDEYNEENKEKLKEYRRNYYREYNKKHRESLNEYRKEYYKSKTTMIQITIETKALLKDIKIKEGLTYDKLIEKLCNDFLQKNNN